MRRGVAIAAGWGAAVGAAALAGVASVDMLAGADHSRALSPQQVTDRLAHASRSPGSGAITPTPGASPGTGTSPSTGTSPTRQYYTTSGGSLWVTCSGGTVTMDTIAPRPGYRIDGSQPGPAQSASVRFKVDVAHGHATEYLVTVTCPDGRPNMTEAADA